MTISARFRYGKTKRSSKSYSGTVWAPSPTTYSITVRRVMKSIRFAKYIVSLCRKTDAEWRKFSKSRIEKIFAQEKSRQMCKRHPQGSSRSRTLGTASGAVYLGSEVFYIRKYLRRKMRTEFGN